MVLPDSRPGLNSASPWAQSGCWHRPRTPPACGSAVAADRGAPQYGSSGPGRRLGTKGRRPLRPRLVERSLAACAQGEMPGQYSAMFDAAERRVRGRGARCGRPAADPGRGRRTARPPTWAALEDYFRLHKAGLRGLQSARHEQLSARCEAAGYPVKSGFTHVFIVEDKSGWRAAVENVVRAATPLPVASASDCASARDWLAGHTQDRVLVVCDVALPMAPAGNPRQSTAGASSRS